VGFEFSVFLPSGSELKNHFYRDSPTTASLRHGSPSGRLIIWHPLELIFFKIFWPRKGLAKLFEGACPNCG